MPVKKIGNTGYRTRNGSDQCNADGQFCPTVEIVVQRKFFGNEFANILLKSHSFTQRGVIKLLRCYRFILIVHKTTAPVIYASKDIHATFLADFPRFYEKRKSNGTFPTRSSAAEVIVSAVYANYDTVCVTNSVQERIFSDICGAYLSDPASFSKAYVYR